MLLNNKIKMNTRLRRLVAAFPSRRPGLETGSVDKGFVVDTVALGQDFSRCFGFSCHSFHTHHHPSSGVGTVGQRVASVPCGLSHLTN
jgi:hypothetical protein